MCCTGQDSLEVPHKYKIGMVLLWRLPEHNEQKKCHKK